MFTEAEQQNFRVKIKQLETKLVDLRGKFTCTTKMLEDRKAHSNMLEVAIRRERTQFQKVKDAFEGSLHQL